MKKILFSPPDITEAEILAVGDVMRSGWITTGSKTKEFEKKIADYCGCPKAVCLNSATACLELILRVLGIGEGDEVITCAYTYTASASPVIHTGAKIVFVDTAKDSFEMDYEVLEQAITEKTKAIIPIDLGGVICDYARIFQIVEEKKTLFSPSNNIQEQFGRIIVIADAAHAFGAMQATKRCGNIADFTSFSFHAVKNLTTAEGGALTWKDHPGLDNEKLYNEFMLLSLHGQTKDAFHKAQLGAWEYDIVSPAYKCNMTDIMAAIGLAQFERYSELLERRREIINRYDKVYKRYGVQVLSHYDGKNQSSGHLYLMRISGKNVKERNELIISLAEKGIATNVHYKPLPMMTAYRNLGFKIEDYPNAYHQYENEITLPLHTKLNDGDIDYIIQNVQHYLEEI